MGFGNTMQNLTSSGSVPNTGGLPQYGNPYSGVGNIDFGDSGLNQMWGARPQYQGTTNQYGQLNSQYQVGNVQNQVPWLQGQLSNDGLSALNSQVLNPDGTMKTGMTAQGQALAGQASGNALAAGGASSQNAMDAAASHGGLDAGARERMGVAGTMAGTNAAQGAFGQVMGQDNAYKENLLSSLPGQNQQQAQSILNQNNWQAGANAGIGEFNAGNAINDVYNKNNQNIAAWGTMGNIWGSDQVSNAEIAAANKPNPGLLGGGGILGTGVPALGGNQIGGGIGSAWNNSGVNNAFSGSPFTGTGYSPWSNGGMQM